MVEYVLILFLTSIMVCSVRTPQILISPSNNINDSDRIRTYDNASNTHRFPTKLQNHILEKIILLYNSLSYCSNEWGLHHIYFY